MSDSPTGSDAARSLLLELAHHLRPVVEAELAAEPNLLLVRHNGRTIDVEVATTVVPSVPAFLYRNVKGRVYGSVGDAEQAAENVRKELRVER